MSVPKVFLSDTVDGKKEERKQKICEVNSV